MKKLLVFLLALALLSCLSGCNGANADVPSTHESTTTIPTTTPGNNATAPSNSEPSAPEQTTATTPTEPVPSETTPSMPVPTEPSLTGPKPTEPVHQHSYVGTVLAAATCTAEGVERFVCACGDSYEESLAKLSHNYKDVLTSPPTCTEKGLRTITCSCGKRYTETVAALGHDWSDWIVTKEATDFEDGEKVRSCETCGIEDKVTIDALGHTHSYVTTTVDATCTEKGYTLYECKCGSHYTKEIKAFGHSYGDWVVTKEATETEAGEQVRTCATCGDKNVQVLPATGEVRESYIDPKLKVEIVGRECNLSYTYQSLGVTNKCDWDNCLSIRIAENGDFNITYYLQDGTKVEHTLRQPNEGYFRRLTILNDGTYVTRLNGSYS